MDFCFAALTSIIELEDTERDEHGRGKWKYATRDGQTLLSIYFNLNIHYWAPHFFSFDGIPLLILLLKPKPTLFWRGGLISLFHPANPLAVVVHKINLLGKALQPCPPVILFGVGLYVGCKGGKTQEKLSNVTVMILWGNALLGCTYIFIFIPR